MNRYEAVERTRVALERETRVRMDAADIDIDVSDDVLILAGEVDRIEAKRIALLVARATNGPDVLDRLCVTPSVRLGDTTIRDGLCSRLQGEAEYEQIPVRCPLPGEHDTASGTGGERSRHGIRAVVSDAVVTLQGSVSTLWHRQLAGLHAWKVLGCRNVINELRAPPGGDRELEANLRRWFDRSRALRAGRIVISAHDGTVTLRGTVPTTYEQNLAGQDPWFIDEVRGVVNEIQVEGRAP